MIDVRSPSEFNEAHIPTALNVPLLNDVERIEVGTLYRRSGKERARARGLEIVRPKMASLYRGVCSAIQTKVAGNFTEPTRPQWDEVFDLVNREMLSSDFGALLGDEASAEAGATACKSVRPVVNQDGGASALPLVFCCWRGGARSKSMALFASALGFNAGFIDGGHKAYRKVAFDFLEAGQYPFKLCTLYGLTGSGKTKIIRQWKREGRPVIDLEELASHRGSAFGQVGIEKLGQQKDFENNLFWEMQKWADQEAKVVVVEGESRRIGRVNLPEAFMRAMLDGYHVRVDVTIEDRVRNILEDYVAPLKEETMIRQAAAALEGIRKRLGGEKYEELRVLLNGKNYGEFTRRLLVDYYDNKYALSRSSDDFYHVRIKGADDWGQLRL